MNKEIIKNKQTKFVKDKLAFSEGFAYKWSGIMRGRSPWDTPSSNIVTEQSESESDSSLSSSITHPTGSHPTDSTIPNFTCK